MKIDIEMAESDLKELIFKKLEELTNMTVKKHNIQILVKSKQNYKSEWEVADFKAIYSTYNEEV